MTSSNHWFSGAVLAWGRTYMLPTHKRIGKQINHHQTRTCPMYQANSVFRDFGGASGKTWSISSHGNTFFFNKPTAIVHLVFCFATPRNEWQRDCPTSFDFQGMQVDLFQQLESAPTNSEGGRSEERVMKWHILLGDQTMQMYGNGPGNFEGVPYNRAWFGLAK